MDQQESERRAGIMRRNEEREAMLETRRRHTNSQILLGFGSSTPRWEAEPADMGKRWALGARGVYWRGMWMVGAVRVCISNCEVMQKSSGIHDRWRSE